MRAVCCVLVLVVSLYLLRFWRPRRHTHGTCRSEVTQLFIASVLAAQGLTQAPCQPGVPFPSSSGLLTVFGAARVTGWGTYVFPASSVSAVGWLACVRTLSGTRCRRAKSTFRHEPSVAIFRLEACRCVCTVRLLSACFCLPSQPSQWARVLAPRPAPPTRSTT